MPNHQQAKKIIRKYITYLLGVIVVAFLAWYLYQNHNIFHTLKNIRWQQIASIALLDLITFLIIGFLDMSMIRRFDPTVRFLDCYLLTYANNFLNKILPTIGGGATFRAVFLNAKYHLPYSQFISTLAGTYVISFLSTSAIGTICMLVIFALHNVFNWLIFLVFLGIFLGCFFIVLFSPRIPETSNPIVSILRSILEGWNMIKTDRGFILLYAFFSIILLCLTAFQILISYQALGLTTPILPMLFLSTFWIILLFLNFTPDGIGTREGIYAFSSGLVQIPNNLLVLGSLVLRAVSVCTTFILGGICYSILVGRLRVLKNGSSL